MREYPKLARIFAVDLRTLGVFRIALAGAVLNDLLIRAADFHEHYTDAGLLPVSEVVPTRIGSALIPFHLWSGSAGYQAALFVIAGIFALGMLVGYRTRLCTIATWLLQASLCERMPDLLYGADSLLRSLLLWAMFLPLGARFAIDARKGENAAKDNAYFSAASAAIMLQCVFLYVFAALFKLEVDVWRNGTHLSLALEHDWWVRPLGKMLHPYRWLTVVLTYSTLVIEGLVPFVLLVPRKSTRAVGLVLMLGFQAGLSICMAVGMFPVVFVTSLIPFIPTWLWDAVGRKPGATADPPARPAGSAVVNGLVTVMIGWTLLLNASALRDGAIRSRIPWPVLRVSQVFGWDQFWGMFTSSMTRSDGWLVVRGTLADGTQINVLQPDWPVTDEKPASVAATLSNHRWTRLFLANIRGRHEVFWGRYESAMKRKWAREHPSEPALLSVEVVFFHEPIPENGADGVEREQLWPLEPEPPAQE